MPTIAAISDFRGEIVIANKSDVAISEGITWFINKYEPVFLRELFGSDFAALFIAGLNPPVTDPVTPVDARWTALLTPNGYDLKTAIDNFIYYWYMRDQDSQTVGVGTVKTANQNAVTVSAADKVTRTWFEMVGIAFQTLRYLNTNASLYPEFVMPHWFNGFYFAWANWGYSADVFSSDYFYKFCYGRIKIPDIFIPINRMGL